MQEVDVNLEAPEEEAQSLCADLQSSSHEMAATSILHRALDVEVTDKSFQMPK